MLNVLIHEATNAHLTPWYRYAYETRGHFRDSGDMGELNQEVIQHRRWLVTFTRSIRARKLILNRFSARYAGKRIDVDEEDEEGDDSYCKA